MVYKYLVKNIRRFSSRGSVVFGALSRQLHSSSSSSFRPSMPCLFCRLLYDIPSNQLEEFIVANGALTSIPWRMNNNPPIAAFSGLPATGITPATAATPGKTVWATSEAVHNVDCIPRVLEPAVEKEINLNPVLLIQENRQWYLERRHRLQYRPMCFASDRSF